MRKIEMKNAKIEIHCNDRDTKLTEEIHRNLVKVEPSLRFVMPFDSKSKLMDQPLFYSIVREKTDLFIIVITDDKENDTTFNNTVYWLNRNNNVRPFIIVSFDENFTHYWAHRNAKAIVNVKSEDDIISIAQAIADAVWGI